MRTVSFSSPEVRNILNRQFINVFTDTTGDPSAGRSIGHAPREPAGFCIRGNGKQNVQTLFLTPAGEIFHVATGFLSPEDLVTEAEFALQVYGRMQEETSRPRDVVVETHRQRLEQAGFTSDQIRSRNPMEAMMAGMAMPAMGSLTPTRSGTGIPGNMNDVFSGLIRNQFLGDNRFSMDYPLMSRRALQADPTRLVGNGQSFFSSSASGTMPSLDGRR